MRLRGYALPLRPGTGRGKSAFLPPRRVRWTGPSCSCAVRQPAGGGYWACFYPHPAAGDSPGFGMGRGRPLHWGAVAPLWGGAGNLAHLLLVMSGRAHSAGRADHRPLCPFHTGAGGSAARHGATAGVPACDAPPAPAPSACPGRMGGPGTLGVLERPRLDNDTRHRKRYRQFCRRGAWRGAGGGPVPLAGGCRPLRGGGAKQAVAALADRTGGKQRLAAPALSCAGDRRASILCAAGKRACVRICPRPDREVLSPFGKSPPAAVSERYAGGELLVAEL